MMTAPPLALPAAPDVGRGDGETGGGKEREIDSSYPYKRKGVYVC